MCTSQLSTAVLALTAELATFLHRRVCAPRKTRVKTLAVDFGGSLAPGMDETDRRIRSVLEPVTAHPGSFDAAGMSRGEPGVPKRFDWRGKTYVVAEVLGMRRETEDAGGDAYVRRHAFRVRTESGEVMVLSGSRGARGASRWILRSIEEGPATGASSP